MFTISLDQSQNLLTIRYSGRVSADETRQCAWEIQEVITGTKPAFRLLVDLTGLEAMDVSAAPHIREIMEMCNQHGVAKVIRVIPDPTRDIGLQIMSYFHYRGDVHIITCSSLDEAVKVMATTDG